MWIHNKEAIAFWFLCSLCFPFALWFLSFSWDPFVGVRITARCPPAQPNASAARSVTVTPPMTAVTIKTGGTMLRTRAFPVLHEVLHACEPNQGGRLNANSLTTFLHNPIAPDLVNGKSLLGVDQPSNTSLKMEFQCCVCFWRNAKFLNVPSAISNKVMSLREGKVRALF